MSWNNIKNKYGNVQINNTNSNTSNNSSWERIKKKYANIEVTNSSANTVTRKTGENLLKNLPYSNSTKISKVVQRDTSLLDKAKNLISNTSNKISDGVNSTTKKIANTSLDFAESKRTNNEYEKYKAPTNNTEEQQLATQQAVKQTQNAEQKVTRKNSIESYKQAKKEREAQALVTDEQLLENLSKMSGSQRVAEIYNITKNNDDFNRLNNQVIQYQTMKKATEKANKINEDMTNGNYSSAIGHVAAGVPVKARDSLTTTMASINSLADAAGIVKAPTNSYIKSSGDDLLKTNKAVTNEYGQTTSQIDNGAVRTAANVSGTIGSMTPSIAASMILPGAGRVLQGVQVGADSYQENLNDDGSNRLRSVIAGAAKGYTSYALEGLTGGNVLSSGSLDDWAVKTIASKTSNKSLQKLASMVYEVGGEVLEEEVENNVDYVIDKVINNKDLPDFKDWWSETSETAKQTILSTLALKVLGLGGNTYKDVQEYSQNAEMNKWISEAEQIIEKENLKIDSEKLQQKNNINELLSQLAQNQQNTSTQQITPTIQNNVQNGISEQNNSILSNKEVPMLNYQYEKSDNVKINNLRQDANRYFNNSEKARNYVSMLERIITDKNIDIRLDADLKTPDGKVANGSYSNGVITINPNSTRAGEFIAVHELTHAIGNDSMKNIIETYRQSNPEFNTAVEKLLQNYNSTEITEEALSDVSAQLFGNQEFINNVAQTNPNIFKKIYSEIKYLWHQFRGYKNQDQFVEDLYYKWTQAYNSSNKLNETGNYYIEPIANFNETEYNNIIEEKLTKKEYAILRSIINSDSNIKPGINYIEVTNGRYTVYYKGFDDFKVMSRKVDADAGRINKRNDTTGRKTRYSKTFEQSIGNEGTTTNNDEVSNFNKTGTRKRSGSNSSSGTNIENDVNIPMQESENNSGSFNLPKRDNLGRTLSKEQQEYFRNSKIRDENGNLLTVYHGSNSEFTVFDAKKSGQASKESKVGFWFTETKEGAENFANSLWYGDKKATSYETYLNIKNPKVYNSIDNSIELENIDNRIKEQKNIIRKLENKNIAIEINKQELKWATSKEELQDIAKIEGIDFEDAERYNDAVKKYNKLEEEYDNKKYGDSYEQFRTEIYKIANKSASDANFGGTGMWLENEKEIISKFKQQLIDEGYDGIIIKNTKYDSDTMGKNNNQYVAFYPEQIKNADNTNPTSNPDIRYSLPTKEWQQYLDENYKASGTRTNLADIRLPVKNNNKFPVNQEAEIANILQKPAEKVKEKDRSWAIIKANLIDKGMVFEELSRKTGNRELQGKWDFTLTSTARGQNAIGNARYELNPNTKTQKQISKSLTDIIDEVGENTADFYSYMYHQLNIDRMTLEERFSGDTGINYERKNTIKNKPVFGESVTAQISRQKVAELEKKHPEFKEYAKDVYDYLDANTKELVDNGVISKETQQLFKDMYPHYVPISRVRNKGIAINVPLDTGRTGINSPIKKATGGSSDINPLFETIADRTLQTYRASARNSFGIELKNTINQTNQLKQFAEQTDIDTLMEDMTDEEQNKQLLQKGENGENPTFTVFEKGEKVTYEINRDMYDALKPKNELLSKIDENKISKIANKINNFRRGLLTEYNPVFSLTNAIKDSQDILLNSQHSGKTYVKIPEATAQILSKGYWYNEYIQNGGLQNSYFKDGEFDTTKNNLPTKIKKTITFPLRAISSVNNVIEMTPRLAEYIVSREQGRSIETSMLDAARVTTNFKAGGDITKTLNRNGFTFLNASVQGMQQQIRNIQEANAKGLKGYAILACKYAIAGAPVLLLNNLIWADDDEYEELQDYVKDNYYIIGKLSGGNFLRIPKGRAVATIQKIVSNANEFIKNDSINSDEVGKVFWKDVKNDIKFGIDNLAPNNPIENNILSPIFQVIANKTWYGDDLVPSRLQNKPKEEQYDETTDSFSRWLGEKAKISPIKINYLIDQYFGGASDVILPMLTPQAENNVLEDKFIANTTMKNKYPGEFFAKVDELEINQNSSKATDEDILKYKYISSVSKDIGELYAKKREIQNSSATDKEKKARLIEVQKRINALAKDSLENVDFIQKSGDTAIIGEEKYYKYKGEWKQLSEEEAKKIKGISLNTYANYQNKVATLSDAKKKKDESVSQKDRVKILDNANYTANEKDKIYTQIINTDDNTYQILKKLDSNKNIINQYLDYLQADLEADREDDGTEKGKAISGTKKKKVSNYINSIDNKDMSYVQKLYLAGINTTLSSSEKKKLFTYINENKSLTSKEKMEALDKLQGFTVYKNGKVKW